MSHPFRDSYAGVPRTLSEIAPDGVHASLFEYRPGKHRVTFPRAYDRPTFTPCDRHPSTGEALLPVPPRRSYVEDNQGRIMTASRSQADRQLWALERAADALLKAAGEVIHRLDIIDRDTRLPIVAPDPAAYRGPVRYKAPAPVRYEVASVTTWAYGPVDLYSVTGDADALLAAADGLLVGSYVPAPVKVTLCQTVQPRRNVRFVGVTSGFGFKRSARAKAQEVRSDADKADALGTRGPRATALTVSSANLSRAMRRAPEDAKAVAALVASVLSTSTAGAVIPLTDGASVRVIDRRDSRLLGARIDADADLVDTHTKMAQRIALAGLSLAD